MTIPGSSYRCGCDSIASTFYTQPQDRNHLQKGNCSDDVLKHIDITNRNTKSKIGNMTPEKTLSFNS